MTTSAYVLGIETSSRLVGVALADHERVLSSVERLTPHPRADDLRAMVEQVLAAARLSLDDVTGLALSRGPGSFTGLRIGASFVKGLTIARPIPTVGVATMDVIAHNLWGARGTAVVVLDAKQDQLYAAAFAMRGGAPKRLTVDRLGLPKALHSVLRRGTLMTGDGLAAYGAVLRRQLPQRWTPAPELLWWPRATVVARLGAARLARGRHDDPQTLVPEYLYPSTCTIKPGSQGRR